MFLATCTHCGRRELRGTRAIELLVNTGHGTEAVYRCTGCQTVNVLHPHSTARTAPAAAPVAA